MKKVNGIREFSKNTRISTCDVVTRTKRIQVSLGWADRGPFMCVRSRYFKDLSLEDVKRLKEAKTPQEYNDIMEEFIFRKQDNVRATSKTSESL